MHPFCPLVHVQIGIGADGSPGTFDVEMESISVTTTTPQPPAPPAPPAQGTTLVDLSAKTYRLFVVNDPVMGGRSTSTFEQSREGIAVFNGTVRIVPQLKAPGFCNAEIQSNSFLHPNFPDATAQYSATGGLVYRVKSNGPLTAFKVAYGTSGEYNFGSWKADVTVPADGQLHNIFVPWNHFSNKWSPSTGEPTVKCSDSPKVCPTKDSLSKIGAVGLWAEGVAGSFHVELHSVTAVATAPSGAATTCKKTEYCCPDAKHCLTPTSVSCAKDPTVCSASQACCPLTKLCVDVGAPCKSPCADQGTYCCPDALHCLAPAAPVPLFCKAASDCATGDVCCPLTNICVSVGATCTPP